MGKQNFKVLENSNKAIQIFKRVFQKNGSKMELVPFEDIEIKIKELKKDYVSYFEVIDEASCVKVTYLKSLFSDNYVVKKLNI